MPSPCFVPGCKANSGGAAVRVGAYSFPRDELLRKRWSEVIHQNESNILKYSRDDDELLRIHVTSVLFTIKCTKEYIREEVDMPHKCSVPMCRGNYANSTKVSVYSFPADEDLKRMWIWHIRRANFEPTKNSKVCERHFKQSDFETEVSAYNSQTGETITCSLAHKRLKKGAIPSLFLPTSDTVAACQKSSSAEVEKVINKYNTKKNKSKCVPDKSDHLPGNSESSSLVVERRVEDKKGEEMVKRKRKTATDETSSNTMSKSTLNGKLSNALQPSQKSTNTNTENSDSFIFMEMSPFTFLQVKDEPLSDGETPVGFIRNDVASSSVIPVTTSNPVRDDTPSAFIRNSTPSVSVRNIPVVNVPENVQISNVRSISSENGDAASHSTREEESPVEKPDESLKNDFYTKPVDMEERDKAFASLIACELSDLHSYPAVYARTKQSILKLLAEAHFEAITSSMKS